tara:strand:- start:5034 stop:6188 length:1155 start_codon:yes stop_codon:yes gene_type:complete
MKYWWVNLGATHKIALEQGYLWSPKTKSDGKSTYLLYEVMQEPQKGDIVLANVKGTIVSKGVVQNSSYSSIKPRDFENDPNHPYWNREGYRLDVDFEELDKEINVKDLNLSELDTIREKYFPISKAGKAVEAYLLPINGKLWKYLGLDESFKETHNLKEHIDIIEDVMRVTSDKGPMHYKDITEQAINRGLLREYGRTPERSFNRAINQNLDTRFNAHGGGVFSLKGHTRNELKEDKITLNKYKAPKTLDELTKDKFVKSGAAKRKNAFNTHNEMQNEIARILSGKENEIFTVKSGPNVDLCWKKNEEFSFLEVKSINDSNESHQIRLGLGQASEYRVRFQKLGYEVKNCYLAVTAKPKEKYWKEVCKSLDINLITPSDLLKIK